MNRSLSIVLRVGITALLIAYVATQTDAAALVTQLSAISPAWIILALALQYFAILASSQAWMRLLEPFETDHGRPFSRLFQYYLMSRFFNLVGLGTVVGDTMRVYKTRDEDTHLSKPTAAVVAEKSMYFAGFLGVSLAASTVAPIPTAAEGLYRFLLMTVVLLGLGGLLVGAALHLGRLDAVSGPLVEIMERYQSRLDAILLASLSTIGVIVATILSTWVVLTALGSTAPFWYLWVVVPLIAIAVAIPVSVQGIGIRETAYVVFLGFVNISPSTAVAVSLTTFALSIVVALSGGVLYLSGMRKGGVHWI